MKDNLKQLPELLRWAKGLGIDTVGVQPLMPNQNLLRDSDVPSCYSFPLRIQQNNEFHSLGIFVEQVDQRFLERHDLPPDGPLYKAAINSTLFDNAYDYETPHDY